MTLIDELEEYLDEPNIAVIATVGRGSQPHASPVWYLYRDGEFIVIVARDSLKHRDVANNPKIMLTLDRREPDRAERPFAIVMAQGTSKLLPSISRELLLEVATRYLDQEQSKAYADSWDLAELVGIILSPERVILYKGMDKVHEFRGSLRQDSD